MSALVPWAIQTQPALAGFVYEIPKNHINKWELENAEVLDIPSIGMGFNPFLPKEEIMV